MAEPFCITMMSSNNMVCTFTFNTIYCFVLLNDEFMTSLSGNAKMAVICYITPSVIYLEEMKATLLFACRTKLVKGKPQVNEVLDDQSLIHWRQCGLAKVGQQ